MVMAATCRSGWAGSAGADVATASRSCSSAPACRSTRRRASARSARELMGMDKKVLGGRIRLVLLDGSARR